MKHKRYLLIFMAIIALGVVAILVFAFTSPMFHGQQGRQELQGLMMAAVMIVALPIFGGSMLLAVINLPSLWGNNTPLPNSSNDPA
jgi:Ni/Fe-hydrogenase subunit HybB-like protein